MFFARALPPQMRVLFIEKGERRTLQERLARQGQFGAEAIRQRNTSGHEKTWVANSTFGGNSNCWFGCTPRFHPDDFKLKTLHGIGRDWLMSYDDLEPLYCEVEEVMDIAGGGSDHILPRTRAFPSPAHRPSRSDVTLRAASDKWVAQPTARSNGVRRAKCSGNGVCDLCPVDAKFTILNSLDQFARPNARVLLGFEARRVTKANGVATAIEVRGADGREHVIQADLFALGANALFNAAILLRSGFASPALGRGVHEQAARIAIIDCPIENFLGGTSITGHGYHFYAGSHRANHAAVLMENWNAPAVPRLEPGKWAQRLHIKLIAEDLPQDANRIVLEDDEPVIDWRGHHAYALLGLAEAANRLGDAIPAPIEAVHLGDVLPTEAHILGAHRMGASVADGVIDRNLRTFEARNVLALGSGAFPTGSPANPTLTLSALSLHAARAL